MHRKVAEDAVTYLRSPASHRIRATATGNLGREPVAVEQEDKMTTKQQRTDTLASDPERDREVARRCLARLDPNCDRDTLVKVGMALRSVGPDM